MPCRIVVPIYNAASQLTRCFVALRHTLPPEARVLLADDASTDPAVSGACARFAEQATFGVDLLRAEQNLGFVGNVLSAAERCPDDDLLLLNSDTAPAPGWYEAMLACAASDPRIATVTPWSNNAEICSFPQFCRANPMPSADQLGQLGAASSALHALPAADIPTGVGFAMWIARRAWDELGGFDAATFGRGYGEENDFCFRAEAHGWRNVFCPAAYVAHEGNASFSQTGEAPGGVNLARLNARYPDYNARIAAFIEADPLRPSRQALADALISAGSADLT